MRPPDKLEKPVTRLGLPEYPSMNDHLDVYDVSMPVDRCVCFNTSFAAMKEYSQEHQCGLDGLRDRFGCGRGCALCVPYIHTMLATDQTVFPVDLTAFPTSSPGDL